MPDSNPACDNINLILTWFQHSNALRVPWVLSNIALISINCLLHLHGHIASVCFESIPVLKCTRTAVWRFSLWTISWVSRNLGWSLFQAGCSSQPSGLSESHCCHHCHCHGHCCCCCCCHLSSWTTPDLHNLSIVTHPAIICDLKVDTWCCMTSTLISALVTAVAFLLLSMYAYFLSLSEGIPPFNILYEHHPSTKAGWNLTSPTCGHTSWKVLVFSKQSWTEGQKPWALQSFSSPASGSRYPVIF